VVTLLLRPERSLKAFEALPLPFFTCISQPNQYDIYVGTYPRHDPDLITTFGYTALADTDLIDLVELHHWWLGYRMALGNEVCPPDLTEIFIQLIYIIYIYPKSYLEH
jgi:hypothetical protein